MHISVRRLTFGEIPVIVIRTQEQRFATVPLNDESSIWPHMLKLIFG
jgi:hypothetical protein